MTVASPAPIRARFAPCDGTDWTWGVVPLDASNKTDEFAGAARTELPVRSNASLEMSDWTFSAKES